MNLTMEALTPLYGEAVARVLVTSSQYVTSAGPAVGSDALHDAVIELRKFDPPERPHLEAIVDHLRGMEPGHTLPEYAVADRVMVLRRAYERAAQQLATIEANVAEHLGREWLKNGVVNAVSLLYSNFKEAKRAVENAKCCTDAVSTTLHYELAQANKRTAHERYNAAGPALDLACVHERLAEVECRAEPVHEVIAEDLLGVTPNEGGLPDALYKAVRKACLRVAFYVAIGRVPERKGA